MAKRRTVILERLINLEKLLLNGGRKLAELGTIQGVSVDTVRRDVYELQQAGSDVRDVGGVWFATRPVFVVNGKKE